MVEGVNSSMIYLIYCKNFCKCHNVPQHNNKKRKNYLTLTKVPSQPQMHTFHKPTLRWRNVLPQFDKSVNTFYTAHSIFN
jgi:hypothetical protein